MNRRLLIAAIVWSIVLAAFLDLWTSMDFFESILLTLPLALCTMQRSKRLLWLTTAIVVLLTLGVEFGGFNWGEPKELLDASVNRGLLIASLLTLTTLIHLRINQKQDIRLYAAELECRRINLSVQNEGLGVIWRN